MLQLLLMKTDSHPTDSECAASRATEKFIAWSLEVTTQYCANQMPPFLFHVSLPGFALNRAIK